MNQTKFKIWLVKNHLTMREFAKKCGCSVQYISMVSSGKKPLTKKAKEIFERGGYYDKSI